MMIFQKKATFIKITFQDQLIRGLFYDISVANVTWHPIKYKGDHEWWI